jgi:hypothetical protein
MKLIAALYLILFIMVVACWPNWSMHAKPDVYETEQEKQEKEAKPK